MKATDYLKSAHLPGRAGHPEEWRREAMRQLIQLELSERQVAKNLGISRNTVAKWVREDFDKAWQDMRDMGLVQKRPDAAECEAIREACSSPDAVDMAA